MRQQTGFTLVELIMVMVILGILSAIAVPKMMGRSDFAAPAFRSDIVSALRYAQKTAVSHRRLVCAALAASEVTLKIAQDNPATDCDTPLASPSGEPYASKEADIVAGGALVVAANVFFQPSGMITTDGNGTTVARGSISVTGEGPITVEGITGYVE